MTNIFERRPKQEVTAIGRNIDEKSRPDMGGFLSEDIAKSEVHKLTKFDRTLDSNEVLASSEGDKIKKGFKVLKATPRLLFWDLPIAVGIRLPIGLTGGALEGLGNLLIWQRENTNLRRFANIAGLTAITVGLIAVSPFTLPAIALGIAKVVMVGGFSIGLGSMAGYYLGWGISFLGTALDALQDKIGDLAHGGKYNRRL